MRKTIAFICTIILLVGAVGIANAYIISWDGVFTASDFLPQGGTTPAPDDPIEGYFSFSYDDSLLVDPYGNPHFEVPVTSISLTIDGYAYSASDVEVGLAFVGETLMGIYVECTHGDEWAIDIVEPGTNDFIVVRELAESGLHYAAYSTAGNDQVYWDTDNVSVDLEMTAPIPDPSMVFLLGSACLLGAGVRKRFKK